MSDSDRCRPTSAASVVQQEQARVDHPGRGAARSTTFFIACSYRGAKQMTEITLKGTPIQVAGDFPQAGQQAKAFRLVGADLSDVELSSLAGKRKILNIFPSIDTPTCATSRSEEHTSEP